MTPAASAQLLRLQFAALALCLFSLFFVRSFLPAMGWALLMAVTTWPFYQYLLRKTGQRAALSSLVATLTVTVAVVIPVVWLATLVLGELNRIAGFLQKANDEGLPVPAIIDLIPIAGPVLREFWQEQLSPPGQLIPLVMEKLSLHAAAAPVVVKDVGMKLLHWGVEFFFALLTLFFAYLHGSSVAAKCRKIATVVFGGGALPYLHMIPGTMRATVSGMLLVAVGEGVVLGAAYYLAGLPSAITFAIATAFMAIVPGGAPLSFCLASLYLYSTGNPLAALAVISWGAFELFIVDHFIRPRLIGEAAKLPFLVVLFGLLGGLASFGLVGLFIGPTITACAFMMWTNLSAREKPLR